MIDRNLISIDKVLRHMKQIKNGLIVVDAWFPIVITTNGIG